MGRRFTKILVHDMRLQLRNSIYYANGFVLVFYISVLVFAADYIPSWALALFIYTDPSVLGFFFLGALMMLEKAEGARMALAVTPISASTYFWSKTITLTGLALIGSTIIALAARAEVNWPLYLSVVLFTSITFIAIGFPIAVRFKTVTGYLVGSAGILTPITLPMFFALYEPVGLWALFIPTTAQFRLFLVSLGTFEASGIELGLMMAITALTAAGTAMFAIHRLKTELGEK
jgi:fluoroquinolone transport system permease protein